jgi:hypothetical protein
MSCEQQQAPKVLPPICSLYSNVHPRICKPSLDFTKLSQHTRLWRWMVYSRATTSAMALRPPLPAGFFADGAIV